MLISCLVVCVVCGCAFALLFCRVCCVHWLLLRCRCQRRVIVILLVVDCCYCNLTVFDVLLFQCF